MESHAVFKMDSMQCLIAFSRSLSTDLRLNWTPAASSRLSRVPERRYRQLHRLLHGGGRFPRPRDFDHGHTAKLLLLHRSTAAQQTPSSQQQPQRLVFRDGRNELRNCNLSLKKSKPKTCRISVAAVSCFNAADELRRQSEETVKRLIAPKELVSSPLWNFSSNI